MNTPAPLLLASTSRYRRELLQRLGLTFDTRSPEVDEAARDGEPPAQRSLRLAVEKARAVATREPQAIVIGSDQVASLQLGDHIELLRKPGDRERTLLQLAKLSGRSADFHTTVALAMPNGRVLSHTDITRVRFRELSADEIASYVNREPSFDCAGGFKCEGLGVTLFESVATQDPTALIGLPLIGLCRLLREAGVAV
ncbi:MAG: Maf family nucleotide pyrophosphatase [Nevskiaceae bacterium]|jgi:septum formation protein|nr:Maf family nucleotide pyrophosphatase [Nevskiaceae bacterium]